MNLESIWITLNWLTMESKEWKKSLKNSLTMMEKQSTFLRLITE